MLHCVFCDRCLVALCCHVALCFLCVCSCLFVLSCCVGCVACVIFLLVFCVVVLRLWFCVFVHGMFCRIAFFVWRFSPSLCEWPIVLLWLPHPHRHRCAPATSFKCRLQMQTSIADFKCRLQMLSSKQPNAVFVWGIPQRMLACFE